MQPSNYLASLRIESLRNLACTEIGLGPGGNLFFGINGAGKTSVLEAVHFLGSGRSFRASNPRNLLHHDAAFTRVVGRTVGPSGDVVMGIERHRSGELNARVGGQPATSLSALAERLPLVLLDNESAQLIQGSPEQRRRYLDATVFHVEQSFIHHWRRYQRALRQRNAGLRRGTLDADVAWRDELATAGEALTELRQQVIAVLGEKACRVAAELSPDLESLTITLRRGWGNEATLADALRDQLDSDRRQGFTQAGPHRAEIRLTVGDRPASQVLSRGQLKVLATALRLAQGALVEESGNTSPVYLVDDLLAELDASHAKAVCGRLAASGAQVLITAVDLEPLQQWWASPGRVFHVEQGNIIGSAG